MNKDFDAGYLIYQDLKSQYKSLIADTQVINYVKGMMGRIQFTLTLVKDANLIFPF